MDRTAVRVHPFSCWESEGEEGERERKGDPFDGERGVSHSLE